MASTGCEVPRRASSDSKASGSIPASRSASIPVEPRRFDSLPSAATSRASWAKCGGGAPSAANIWICVALFETWSSPRTMWVMARSMSSITLGSR